MSLPPLRLPTFSLDGIPIERRFDFGMLVAPLSICFNTLNERLGREPTVSGVGGDREVQRFLLVALRANWTAFRSVVYSVTERPSNDWDLRYTLSTLPVARAILDLTFTTIFLLAGPNDRWTWFKQAGWRDSKQESDRLKAAHADKDSWRDFLHDFEALNGFLANEAGITDAMKADSSAIRWWPNPGRMAALSADSRDKKFIQLLFDRFYPQLSSSTHMTFPGFARSAAAYLDLSSPDQLKKRRSDLVADVILFVLVQMSEIELRCEIDSGGSSLKAWDVLTRCYETAAEVYSARYR